MAELRFVTGGNGGAVYRDCYIGNMGTPEIVKAIVRNDSSPHVMDYLRDELSQRKNGEALLKAEKERRK
jgi:hypothetical protein